MTSNSANYNMKISNSIKNRYYRFADIAFTQSQKSDMKIKHVSIAVRNGGRIISTGYNEHRSVYKGYNCFISTHSEVKCCINMEKNTKKECNIYIYRVDKNCLKNTKPCSMCIWFMKKSGIKNVIYFDGDNVIKCNIKDIISCNTRSSMRNSDLLSQIRHLI